jgi:hypothetical protein
MRFLPLLTLALGVAGAVPHAVAGIVPSFATVTTAPTQTAGAWYTDRYAPASFANVGTQFGRSDVLGIGISSADSQANRVGFAGGFYNTQGRKFDVIASGVVRASADLYVPSDWRDAQQNGFRRTDMWGTLTTGNAAAPVDLSYVYPIIGFANFGGVARFRGWDGSGGGSGWQDFSATVLFDSWNTLEWEFDSSAGTLKYFVNGALAYTDINLAQANTTFGPVTRAENVMFQAFNFHTAYDPGNPFGNQPVAGFANAASGYNYSALWSNTRAGTVPIPGTVALVALGLLLLGASGIARRQKH